MPCTPCIGIISSREIKCIFLCNQAACDSPTNFVQSFLVLTSVIKPWFPYSILGLYSQQRGLEYQGCFPNFCYLKTRAKHHFPKTDCSAQAALCLGCEQGNNFCVKPSHLHPGNGWRHCLITVSTGLVGTDAQANEYPVCCLGELLSWLLLPSI